MSPERTFVEAPEKPCPFDWEDGKNDKLAGGRVIGLTQNLFAYGFFDGGDSLCRAFIASQQHGETMSQLLSQHSEELRRLYELAIPLFGNDAHNLYGNVGFTAGQRVFDHAHLNLVRRRSQEPSSDKGFELLIDTHNKLVQDIMALAHKCTDPATTAALRKLIS